ncbi:hypothetical protein B0H10DRAFT_2303588 [Mycena sp. CBHHK59/15]|nr:hypothetical protein B0H10DRAFT_2311121 [Mycena sp. CBHHK59/15]KAJ6608195.1 hypothetical protein B0H10DRAFT_2303588 [Mycena sp. CBHHK59/15]
MASTPLKEYFWRGEKQNSSMYHTYCKACVAHHLDGARTTTADLAQSSEEFKEQSGQKQWMVETRMTLAVLFRGAEKPRARKPAARAMEQEELLMQALAEAEENGVLDDGAIEIDSDDEFQP